MTRAVIATVTTIILGTLAWMAAPQIQTPATAAEPAWWM
mgnify:CR=1 FL=1